MIATPLCKKLLDEDYSIKELKTKKRKFRQFLIDSRERIYESAEEMIYSISIEGGDVLDLLKARTEFLNDFYKEKIPLALRIYCVINNITSEKRFPKCTICGRYKIFMKLDTPFFKDICGRRPCMVKIYKQKGIKITPRLRPLTRIKD